MIKYLECSTLKIVDNTKRLYDLRGWVVENGATKAVFNNYNLALKFYAYVKKTRRLFLEQTRRSSN
jgi:hypothetical protein